MTGRIGIVGGHSLPSAEFAIEAQTQAFHGVELLVAEHTVVLARHGLSSFTPAHLIDHRNNLTALRDAGCNRVVAFGSVGSLRSDWPVGTVVAPHDFFAPWINPSVFDDVRGHSMPGFDPAWRSQTVDAWRTATDTPILDGGVYVQTHGPRFETAAEIRFYSSVADIVGMTLVAECLIARELGLDYAPICTVDNIANGVGDRALTVDEFHAGVSANRDRMLADAHALIGALLVNEAQL